MGLECPSPLRLDDASWHPTQDFRLNLRVRSSVSYKLDERGIKKSDLSGFACNPVPTLNGRTAISRHLPSKEAFSSFRDYKLSASKLSP